MYNNNINNYNNNGKVCCFIWLTKIVLYILSIYLFIKTYSLVCLVWSIPKKQNMFSSLFPLICSLFLSEPNWTGGQIGPTASRMWPQARACQLPLLSSLDDRYIRSGFSCRASGEWEEAALILAQRWEVYCGESPAPLGTGWWLCPVLWPCEKLLSQTSLNLSNWSPLQDRNIFHCPVTFPLVSRLCLFLVYSEDDGVRGTQKAEDKIKKRIQAITLRLEM